MDMFLEIEGVTKSFGAQNACVDVTLSICKGELFYLLGPSGCGKSTLLSMIGGLLEPDTGEILLGGSSLKGIPANKRAVNTIFQSYALFPHLSVFENVAFGLRIKRYPDEIIRQNVLEMLTTVSMEDFQNRMPSELSGGQQQRVAIARALVNEPEVLLLDEPFAALDAKLRRQMQLELKSLQHKLKMTFICVTHDQDEALAMADKIAVMNEGRIIQVGTPQEIYNTPKNKFVGTFIGEANFHKNTLIRPEKIKISSSAPTNFEHISGVIKDRSFLGSSDLLIVQSKNQDFKVVVSQHIQEVDLSIGSEVFLSWNPEDARVIEGE